MTPETQANIFAGQMLVVATQRVSASFDTFSGWMVAGFGATLALFISNLDTLSVYLSLARVKCAAVLFVMSAVLAVVDKLLAAFIAAGTTAAIEGAAHGKSLTERNVQIDVEVFFSETEKALYWPGSAFAKRAFIKAQAGDFAGPGRMYTKVAQVQALVVVVQAILCLAAAGVVVRGLAI